jgi:type IV pilus assembly protein PilM
MPIQLTSLKLPEISFLKPRDAFAVDLGSATIKMLQLKQTSGKFSLMKWGVVPLSDTIAEVQAQERKSLSVSRVGEFLAKEKVLLKNVVSSVSGNQVIVRYVKFSKMSREDLSKTLPFEAEPYIPFDIREVDLSFSILNDITEDGQKKMEVLLVAAKKDVLQSRVEIFEELGLRTIVIDLDALALANAYEINCDPEVSESVLLVNIGNTITNMAIVENKVPRVVRDIFIAGSSFTKAIQKNIGCDLKTAEDLKMRYSILVTSEEKEKTLAENQKEALQVSSALIPVTRDLIGEIQRSIDFYISQNPDRSISRILLSGGTANLKNLDKMLHQELKLPVELFNPLKNILGGDVIPENVATNFAIAVGLALRKENDISKK